MIEFDHRYVIVGGLLLACILYRVPLYMLLAVATCSVAAYVRKQYASGWRFAVGHDDGYYGFVRRRQWQTSNVKSFGSVGGIGAVTPQQLHDSHKRQLLNYSVGPTPKLRLNLDGTSPGNLPTSSRHPFTQRSQTTSLASAQWMQMESSTTTVASPDKPKYSGIGVYPFIHLEPRRPTILSYCNSNMIKNKVTVKVALPERTSGYNAMPLAGNSSSGAIASPNKSVDCTTVIEALRTTRKRPLREDGGIQEAGANAKRRLRHKPASSDASPSVSPHLPTEIAQHFESQLSDESLAILLPPMSSSSSQPEQPQLSTSQTVNKVNQPPIQPVPRICGRANTNAIHSSYSSSRRLAQSEGERRAKRKNESATQGAPDAKMGRNPTTQDEIASQPPPAPAAAAVAATQAADEQKSPTSNIETINLEPEVEKSPAGKSGYSFHTTLTGARNPMTVHIPNYIPSLQDHLEDQRADKRRLKNLLARFSKYSDTTEKEVLDKQRKPDEATAVSSVATSTTSPAITSSNNSNNNNQRQQTEAVAATSTTSIVAVPPPSLTISSIQTSLAPSMITSKHSFAPSSSASNALMTSASSNLQRQLLNVATGTTLANPTTSSTTTTAEVLANPSKSFQMPVVTTSESKDNQLTFTFGTNGNEAPPKQASAFASSAAVSSTTSNGTFQFGQGANVPASSSSLFNFGSGGETRPTAGNVSAFGNPGQANSNGTATPAIAQSSGGFSLEQESTSSNNNNNNGMFTFGSSNASSLVTPAFNFNASAATPTFNLGSASTTGFTPVSKLPEAPSSMFSLGTGATSTSSARRSKQALSRHRSSHR